MNGSGLFARIRWYLLSVPIYFKIIGIGFIVALIFSVATFPRTHYVPDQQGNIHFLKNYLSVSWLLTLLICFIIGQALAIVLAGILVRPIKELTKATERLSLGDFTARAAVLTNDEIGILAVKFNQMADKLEIYQKEIGGREDERKRLINRIVQSQEDERKTLSRELHDHFGPSLSALLLMLNTHQKNLPAEHRPDCRKLEREIGNIIDDMRKLSYSLRPSILDDYGLEHALEWYLSFLKEHSKINFQYQYISPAGPGAIPGPAPRLPGEMETALYRIAQEASNNIIKHSGAENVSLVIHRRLDSVILDIEDDGTGFEVDAALHRQSLGLSTIRERTSLLGGECLIESEPGSAGRQAAKGTHIRIKVPLNSGDDDD